LVRVKMSMCGAQIEFYYLSSEEGKEKNAIWC